MPLNGVRWRAIQSQLGSFVIILAIQTSIAMKTNIFVIFQGGGGGGGGTDKLPPVDLRMRYTFILTAMVHVQDIFCTPDQGIRCFTK